MGESGRPTGLPKRRAGGGAGLVGADNALSPMAIGLLLALVAAAGLWVYSLTQLGNMGRDVPAVSFSGEPTPVATAVPGSPFVAGGVTGTVGVGGVDAVGDLAGADGLEAVGRPDAGAGVVGLLRRGPQLLGAPLGLWAGVGAVLGALVDGVGFSVAWRRFGMAPGDVWRAARGLVWS